MEETTPTPIRILRELMVIINNLPKLGKDTESFLKYVEEGILAQPPAYCPLNGLYDYYGKYKRLQKNRGIKA